MNFSAVSVDALITARFIYRWSGNMQGFKSHVEQLLGQETNDLRRPGGQVRKRPAAVCLFYDAVQVNLLIC